jgi:hypothetical protein
LVNLLRGGAVLYVYLPLRGLQKRAVHCSVNRIAEELTRVDGETFGLVVEAGNA